MQAYKFYLIEVDIQGHAIDIHVEGTIVGSADQKLVRDKIVLQERSIIEEITDRKNSYRISIQQIPIVNN